MRIPQADPLAGSHAHSRRWSCGSRRLVANAGLEVVQLGVGVDLVEARTFEGAPRGNAVKFCVSADRPHAEIGGNLHEASQCFGRVAVSSRGWCQPLADLNDAAIGASFEANATHSQTVG